MVVRSLRDSYRRECLGDESRQLFVETGMSFSNEVALRVVESRMSVGDENAERLEKTGRSVGKRNSKIVETGMSTVNEA